MILWQGMGSMIVAVSGMTDLITGSARRSWKVRVRRAGMLALTAVLTLWPVAEQASAAEIDVALKSRRLAAHASEFIPVLIKMNDAVDIQAELPALASGRLRRSARHAMTINLLTRRAAETQAALKVALEASERAGQSRNSRYFWIDNLVGAEVQPAFLDRLEARSDIESIILLPEVELVTPVRATGMSADAAGHESSLDVIGAPAMWAMGYTGRGRLVCGIDTGVRGTHNQLADRWRGLRVPWQHAWHDPRGLTMFPADLGSNPVHHGSHTMGTIVGGDSANGDTVGVAPGAEWIAAFGIGSDDLNTLDLIECLEWTADPDGDPNTTADVPDVLNSSWRFRTAGILQPCNNIMDGIIEHLEAVGVIVIWAAGNEGSGSSTIGYPPNSGTAFGTNFSVGSVNGADTTISFSSSRGPTPCAVDSIKPEVVAPGVAIRSCFGNGDNSYGTISGTSMAAPHVAGAAAILRQVAPQATPAEIKQALFLSAIDRGAVGEDNTYGRGLINIPAAADSLSAIMGGPDLRVETEQLTVAAGIASASEAGKGDSLQAGDTVSIDFLLRNTAIASATSVYLKLATSDPNITLLTDSAWVGIVPGEDTLSVPSSLRFVVDSATPAGQPLVILLELHAAAYLSTHVLRYYTDPAPFPGQYVFDNTLVEFTVTNYGLYGVGDQSYYPLGGSGFVFGPSTTNHLAEGALMFGISEGQISDAARSAGGTGPGFQISDADFAVSPGGAIRTIPGLGGSFQATECIFDDSDAEDPIGIRVVQRSLIFPRGADEGYVMLILTLENISFGAISGLYVGMYHDWDFPVYFFGGRDTVGFAATQNMGYMFDKAQAVQGPYRGVAVLSGSGATANRAVNPQGTLYDPRFEQEGGNGEVYRQDSVKWAMLSGGLGPASAPAGSFGDMLVYTGTGPFDLTSPGDTLQVAFAYVGSEDGLVRLQQNAAAAQIRYDSIVAQATGIGSDPHIPRAFSLRQNYPNPFNPETRIDFTLKRPALVSLTLYNVLGAKVRVLYESVTPAGIHSVVWDGTDQAGKQLGSGVYFYRLSVEGETVARKMLLLR